MKFSLDMDLALLRLAELFKQQSWLYAIDHCYGVPDAAALEAQIVRLAADIHETELDMVHGGRFALVRSPFNEDNYEVLLSIGYLDAEEEPEEVE